LENFLWLPLALGAALGVSLADLTIKRFFGDLSPYTMCLVRWLFAVPFLALVGLFLKWPALDLTFWLAVAAALPLELLAAFLYMKVLKICDLSLCIPLLAFTPVFLILTGWLVLGEALHPAGLVGLVLIAGGSYLLGLGGARFAWWEPLAALAREPGARLMLTVAALFSLTSALGKLAIIHSEPAFFGVLYPTVVGGFLLAAYPFSRAREASTLVSRLTLGLLVGVAVTGEILCHVFGMTLAPAAYVIGVKRLSILFSVILGGLLLQERPFLPRLGAAALMVTGVVLITLKG
jgi:drug/metabolite transporter (DMT)-like permease